MALAGVNRSDRFKPIRKTELSFVNHPIVIAEAGTGTNGFGGVKMFDFPEGRVLVHGVVMNVGLTFDTNFVAVGSGINAACGTATAIATTGAVANTSTRADLTANVQVDPTTNATINLRTQLASAAQFDGTSTAKDMYYNVLVDDADIASASTGTLNGVVIMHWSELGDY
jgi:hypothetical protein